MKASQRMIMIKAVLKKKTKILRIEAIMSFFSVRTEPEICVSFEEIERQERASQIKVSHLLEV